VAAVEQARAAGDALAHAAREIRAGAPQQSPSAPKTETRTAKRHPSTDAAAGAFLPPVRRATPVADADADRVSEAPFAVMFVSLAVLLLAAVPERIVADAGIKSPERIRAGLLLAGCGGLLLALVLLLASA
jgi:hypothetical protein